MLKSINNNEFEKDVLKNEKVVLVDFYATWCPPCKMLAPVLEKVAAVHDEFDIIKINIDDNQDLAIKYRIEVVPTMGIFKAGQKVGEIVGLVNEDKIVTEVSKYL